MRLKTKGTSCTIDGIEYKSVNGMIDLPFEVSEEFIRLHGFEIPTTEEVQSAYDVQRPSLFGLESGPQRKRGRK